MKKLITVIALLVAVSANAQFSIFGEIGIDPNMALEGPHGDGGTFNAEFKGGLDWEKQRVGIGYEMHSAIKYEKWSAFYDQKFNITEKLQLYVGLEASTITRRDKYTSDHRDVTTTPSYGGNMGIYYDIHFNGSPTGFHIGVNSNAFRGETEYKMYKSGYWKEFRTDVMIVLIRKF